MSERRSSRTVEVFAQRAVYLPGSSLRPACCSGLDRVLVGHIIISTLRLRLIQPSLLGHETLIELLQRLINTYAAEVVLLRLLGLAHFLERPFRLAEVVAAVEEDAPSKVDAFFEGIDEDPVRRSACRARDGRVVDG